MENNRVKLIMETMWNTEWQGAERDTGLLQSAILGLCAIGKITRGGGLCEGHAGGGTAAYGKRNEESGIRNSHA